MAHLPIFTISALALLIPLLPLSVPAETEQQTPAIAPLPVTPAETSVATTPAETSAPGKAAAAKSKPTPPKKSSGNRRWLIKQRDGAGTVKPSKAAPVKWTSTRQQARCEALLPRLRESFDKARYYSIQGDSCKTAAHASRFLEAYDTCEAQCPPGYLKGLGYRDLIPRNMQVLADLGEARCQDRSMTVKTDTSRGATPPPKPLAP